MNLQVHRNTPTLKVNDSRGLAVRQVDYLRTGIETPALALISRQVHDALGRLIAQWDPRLFGVAPKPNVSTAYGLSGHAVWFDSVDAGWRLNLIGVAGQSLRRWDARGCHWQTDYDNQLRVVAVHEQPPEQPQTIVEYVEYAGNLADPAHNLRGQKIAQDDPSGSLVFPSFSLLGIPLRETRTFLDGMACTTSWRYNAKGAVLTQTDAAGHRQHTGFDLAGQLKHVFLQLKDESDPQPLYQHLTYNAFGQLDTQRAGNGVVSTWGHDPADGRLTSLKAGIPGQALRQDLGYVYDRTGNVLRIEDHTLSPVFFANQRTDGHRDFIYDSLYRLTGASGFEGETPHLQPGLPELIKPEDCGRRFNYTQQYDYDPGGNLTRLRHVRDGHCYTRCLRIAPHSNRGLAWQTGDPDPDFSRGFDAHGNQGLLQAGQPLGWNHRDQLNNVTLIQRDSGASDEETYAYSQGVRVHKRLIRQARALSHIDDVRYLPGLEIRTRDDSQELHVITLAGGHGSVRCLYWAKGKPDGIDAHQLRYSLDDHLGSSSLELDRNGALISREVYYPFGGSCWWAARSAVEADYKTVRYSGKEMDISGLYYYGQRYYAPWLQRWVSADPAGDVDGLNLYAMVGNNPMLYVDRNGDIRHVAEALNTVAQGATTAANIAGDLHNAASTFDALVPDNAFTAEENKAMTFWKFARSKSGRASFKWGAGIGLAIGGAVGTVFGPGWGNLTGSLIGAVVGGAVGVGIRYLTYKHNFKAGQYTEAIQTVSRDVANAANDVANGKVPEMVSNALDELIPKDIQFALNAMTRAERLDLSRFDPKDPIYLEKLIAVTERAEQAARQKADEIMADNGLEGFAERIRELTDKAAALPDKASELMSESGDLIPDGFLNQGAAQTQALASALDPRATVKPRTRRTLETSV
ncbi:RHS repeat-associated core domain-containing protein [Pseudomonas purpurea]|uniref:RHS repeat-associated core domain-containing protein n=1 Tax=Pseudomonas purpurea TaxID=3136737 RepID=UPI0032671D7A